MRVAQVGPYSNGVVVLSEREGCEILKTVFERRGYAIEENVPFAEHGVEFNCDGWDAKARVGYEYMTQEAHDHEDLDPEELLKLSEWAKQGGAAVFIIDETDIESADELAEAADRFIDELQRLRGQKS